MGVICSSCRPVARRTGLPGPGHLQACRRGRSKSIGVSRRLHADQRAIMFPYPALILSVFFAVQAGAQESAQPSARGNQVSTSTQFSDALQDRAIRACHCDRFRCECPPERLKDADRTFATFAISPSSVFAKARPVFRLGGRTGRTRECIVAYEVELSGEDDLVIDWQRVTLIAGGVAQAALPGFARHATSNLLQRPSMAPAGATLRETVFPDGQDGQCIGGPEQTIGIDIPIRLGPNVGFSEARVRFETTSEPVAMSEAEVFKDLPRPTSRKSGGGCALPTPQDTSDEQDLAAWTAKRRVLHID
jgi:hypothetical protein